MLSDSWQRWRRELAFALVGRGMFQATVGRRAGKWLGDSRDEE